MDIARNSIILVFMIIVSLSLGFIVWAHFALSFQMSSFLGMSAFLVQVSSYLLFWKSHSERPLKKSIDDMMLLETDNNHRIEVLSNEIQSLHENAKNITQSEIEPLASELEVIGSLIKQLAENSADSEMRIAELEQELKAYKMAEEERHKKAAEKKRFDALQGRYSNHDAESYRTRQTASPSPRIKADTILLDDDIQFAPDYDDIHQTAPKETKPGHHLVMAVRDAVRDNQIDLYLQPIVRLPQRKPVFYEALSRLRSHDGDLIRPSDYMKTAEHIGALPVLDKMLLVRAVQILQKLLARKADAVVVCNISATSLADTRFFNDFKMLLQAKSDLANHLIFEFNQEMVTSFSAIEEESLLALKDLGFRFAVDNVTDLSMNFRHLVTLGFHFVKLPAIVLLSARNTGTKDIHAEDIPRYLARNGLDVIVDHIETETQVVELLDYDIKYGQGFLFSAPREVKPDVSTSLKKNEALGQRLAG